MRAKLIEFIQQHRRELVERTDDALLRNPTTREMVADYSHAERENWIEEFFDSFIALLRDRHDLVLIDWHQDTLERELLSGFSLIEAGVCLIVFRNQIKRLLWDKLTEPDQRDTLLGIIRTVDREFDMQMLKKSQIYLKAAEADLADWASRVEVERTKLNSLLQSMGDGVIVVDRDMNVTFENEVSRRLYGRAIGRKCYEVFTDGNRICDECTLDRTMEDGHIRTVVRKRARGDQTLWLEVTSAPVRNEHGDIVGGIETFRDITRRKRAEMKIERLNRQLEAKQAKTDQDLNLAAVVQQSMLPAPVTKDRLEVHVANVPIGQIGGDYVNVQFANHDVVYLSICDVSGHGIASAMLATRIDSHVKTLVQDGMSPRDILSGLHNFIFRHFSDAELFFTFFCSRIDLVTRRMTWAGGGHPAAVVLHGNGVTEHLPSQNALLGVFDGCVSAEGQDEMQLFPGDTLVMYTDGLAGALTHGNLQEEETVIEATLHNLDPMPAPALCRTIETLAVEKRGGDASDDMTLIVARVK